MRFCVIMIATVKFRKDNKIINSWFIVRHNAPLHAIDNATIMHYEIITLFGYQAQDGAVPP